MTNIQVKSKNYRWDAETLNSLPLRDVASSLNIDLKRSMRCPLPNHEDERPSFSYNPNKNLWYCHCSTGRNGLALVMAARQCSFKEAGDFLHNFFYSSQPKRYHKCPPPKLIKRPTLNYSHDENSADYEVYNFILKELKLTNKVIEYFHNRCISKDTLERFQIGEIENLSKMLSLLINNFNYDRLVAAGLMSDSSSKHSPFLINFKNKIIFPFKSQENCEYFQARIFGKEKKYRWLNLNHLPPRVFNRQILDNNDLKYIYM